MKMVMIYTACASLDEVKKITSMLLEKKVAACVNVLPEITAIYPWKGEVTEGRETPFLVKTSPEHKNEAVRIIQSMHTYEVPGIVCWDAESLHTDYSSWMKENLKDFV